MPVRIKKILFTACLFFFIQHLYPQVTIITGKITDASTHEAIPFAAVIFKGSTIGTNSDFEGNYIIKTAKPGDSLTARMMGFIPKTKAVVKGSNNVIDFQLMPSTFEMAGVTIFPGENPAFPILRNVWKNKHINNKDKLDAYEYNCYTKIEISADNVDDFSKTAIMKPFKTVFDSLQVAAGMDGQMVLPLFMSENVSEVYYLKNPKRSKEIIKASKLTGIGVDDAQLFTQYAGSSFQEYNFYTDWLNIFERDFVSPIASEGMNYYKYSLNDTIVIDGKTCFEIQVKPLRDQDLAFTGTIWINDTTFALKRIILEVGKKANLNFIERFKIQQDLTQVGDSVWMPHKTRVLVDVIQPTQKTFGMLGKFYTSNWDFIINKPKELKFYEDKIELEDDAREYQKDFWDTIRPEKFTQIDQSVYNIIDSLKYIPKVKNYVKFGKFAIKGYVNLKKFEVGPYSLLYGYNIVEGSRIRIGVKSTVDLSKKWVIKGHAAYGFKDDRFKYSLKLERFISREWWTKVGVQYKYDIVGMGMGDDLYESNSIFEASSQIGLFTRMNEVRYARFWFESDLSHGLSQKIDFNSKYFRPMGDLVFAWYDKNGEKRTDYFISEINFITRYAPKEMMLIDNNDRVSISASDWPVMTLSYSLGVPDILKSDFMYHKFSLTVSQNLKCGMFGRLNYKVIGTKYLGQVPYPLLNILPGNETIFRSPDNYNMMNFFEFVADQSVEIRITHFFNGFFFNRVPLLKKLKLREVVGGNVVFGSMSNSNMSILAETDPLGRTCTQFKTLTFTQPYAEVFYGVENILRFIRIDAFHRLTYLDDDAPRFGIKGTVYFTL